jgi:Fur family ferric uptake transcriptional regulator
MNRSILQRTLIEKGLRLTGPRLRVLDVFLEDSRPLTIAETYRRLGRTRVHLASVYRAVQALCSLGVLTRVDQVAQAQRYELADPYQKHHHHLICQACGKIEDLEYCALPGMEKKIRGLTRFRVIKHEVRFLGICGECAA